MKLYFYRGNYPNFGDELNAEILPLLFPGLFDDNESVLFLGIGSVIFDCYPHDAIKVVYGSGFGGYTAAPKIDDNWRVYCVRGPQTARVLGLNPELSAGDAAILINRRRRPHLPKTHRFSFMPHWESMRRGAWSAACRMAGVRLIDPSMPVQDVLKMIETSEVVIAEAMHGAIVADALRVPWIPVLPFDRAHHFKWRDWAEALELNLVHERIFPSTVAELAMQRHHEGEGRALAGGNRLTNIVLPARDLAMTLRAAASLDRLKKVEPRLSSDAALNRALDHLESSAEQIRRDFSIRGQ